jgi:hypothetical protein
VENRITIETPQVIELKKLLKEAVELLKGYNDLIKKDYNLKDYSPGTNIDEFLDKIKEVEL